MVWKTVFVASFIDLTVEGMDIQMLSLTLLSLIAEFVLDLRLLVGSVQSLY